MIQLAYFPFTKNEGGTNSILSAIELFLCYYQRQMPSIKTGEVRMLAKTGEKLDYGGGTGHFKPCHHGYNESRLWLMCGCDRTCHVTSCVCVMQFVKSGEHKACVIDGHRSGIKDTKKDTFSFSPSGTCDALTFVSTERCRSLFAMSGKRLPEKSSCWV